MILIEIKNIIKELEEILINDERFKDSYHFKNQVKMIYKKNNLNNISNNNTDITPFISNLIALNKECKQPTIEPTIEPRIEPTIDPTIDTSIYSLIDPLLKDILEYTEPKDTCGIIRDKIDESHKTIFKK